MISLTIVLNLSIYHKLNFRILYIFYNNKANLLIANETDRQAGGRLRIQKWSGVNE